MVALLAFVSAACSTSAAETPYPTRPVRFVVGFPPGGGVDAMARLLSPKLSDAMGQNWIVDARSGAGGNLGAEIVARSNPDGYTTLLALSTQLTVNPGLYKMPFSVEKDLQPVTMVVKAEHILVVHPSVPARTLNEFIALARQKPGTLNFPSAGVGSSIHMAGELLKKRVGIDMVHVAYKGAGPAIASMLAGETQVLTGTVVSALTHLNTGKLRALASLGARRSKVLPDLPTVAESGYPGFEADAWYGVLVPSGTPKSIVERIRSEVLTALQYPDVRTAMSRLGLDPETSTPADLAARIKAETSMYAVLIKEAGIRAE
jgi:tripartite-type tricarboxylate transporter receptor subunit TctC